MKTKVNNLKDELIKDYDELIKTRKYYPKNAKDIIIDQILDNPKYAEIIQEAVKIYINTYLGEIHGNI